MSEPGVLKVVSQSIAIELAGGQGVLLLHGAAPEIPVTRPHRIRLPEGLVTISL